MQFKCKIGLVIHVGKKLSKSALICKNSCSDELWVMEKVAEVNGKLYVISGHLCKNRYEACSWRMKMWQTCGFLERSSVQQKMIEPVMCKLNVKCKTLW